MRTRPAFANPPAVALALGLVFTVVVLLVRDVRVAYDNPNLHVALNAVEGMIAAVLAFVWSGRLRQQRMLSDALLVVGFSIAATVNLVMAVMPSGPVERPGVLWTAAAWRVVAGATIAAAAVTRGRPASLRWIVAPLGGLVVGVLCGVVGRSTELNPGHLGTLTASTDPADLTGHVMLRVAHGAGVASYGVAAVFFVLRAERTRDPVLGLFATGAVLGALARVHYAVFPSLYTNIVFTGDVLRFVSYALFGVAGAVEIERYWQATTEAAVVNERRRAAREVHDGVLQELSFIRSHTSALSLRAPESTELAAIADSADRALSEARNLIPVLSGSGEVVSHLGPALLRTAEAVATRMHVQVELTEVEPLRAPQAVAHALSRVVREATTNAAVHGRASTVRLRIARDNGNIALTITDDGAGFDPASTNRSGFGLISIRERVAALGGDASITSALGRGTVVDVHVPAP